MRGVDRSDEHRRGPKGQHTTWLDRHFYSGARIAADPLPLRADREKAERAKLHRFSADQGFRNLFQRHFEYVARLSAGESLAGLIDGVQEISPRRCLSVRFIRQ